MLILLSGNCEIIKKYIKPSDKIGFIPTASELATDRWYMEKYRDYFIKEKYDLINIDITNETKDKILNKFNSSDVIFVPGGNTFYLLQQLKKRDVFQDLISFAKNKIYIGVSAGACIACPNIEYLEKFDNKDEAVDLVSYDAMNLINGYILPHYNAKEKYSKLIDEVVNEHKEVNYLVLTNEQAIIVEDKDNYKIIDTE